MHRPLRDPLNRAFYLPRLPREYYQGDAVIFWTLPVAHRATGWLDQTFHASFRELMLHASARSHLTCPIYCLMPDHIHLMWMGLHLHTDQRNAMSFLRTHLEPLLTPAKFQHQAYDEVLREKERRKSAFASSCFYIAANPVRAELVTTPDEWPYSGCIVPGYPDLNCFSADFWPTFWRIYTKLRHPDSSNILLPQIPSP